MLELRRDVPRRELMAALTPKLALLMTVPPLLWAGNAVTGRLMAGQVPPLTLNLMRWSLTALLLLPWAWRALVPWQRLAARWPYLLALGLLGVGLFNSLQYLALVTSPALNVTLVAASMPVWMLAVGALCWRERPSRRQLVGAAIGFCGVCIVIGRGSLDALRHVRFVPGDLYILLAVIGWAFYSWLLARPPPHMRGEAAPGWDWAGLLLVQALFGLPAAALFSTGEQLLGAAPVRWSAGVAAAVIYTAVAASVVAYRCWGLAVARGGPALAAVFNNLTPVFAALLSALWLGELPQPYHVAAFALIVCGIGISAWRPPSARTIANIGAAAPRGAQNDPG